jgi:Family of unknown function (DUF6893)
MRRLMMGAFGLWIAYMVVQSLPELKRYMKIKSM